jgi:hypothetical protein
MTQVNQYPAIAGKYLDSDDTEHNLIDYVGALTTIDSRRKYLHDGKAFNMDAFDTIGAGSVFTFWGKNTGDKKVHVDQVYFNPGTFQIDFIDDATFTLGGNAYTLFADENPAHIGTTYNLAPAFNMNKMSDNTPTFKIYMQANGLVKTGGTIFAREYNQSGSNNNAQWIMGPGQSFVGQFKNTGTTSLQYFLRMIWYEVD